MKIYVSGSYAEQPRLRDRATELLHHGHAITSTWLHEVQQPKHLSEHEWFKALAIKDLAEVAAADCIIMDVDGTSTSGGRYTEWGFALGRFNMLKLVVGSNHYGVFLKLADESFTNWTEVLDYMSKAHNPK